MKRRSLFPLKCIMNKAWSYARRAQCVHGGKVKGWLSVALKRAWAEIKADPVAQETKKIIMEMRARAAAGFKPIQATRYDKARNMAWMGR
jgi:hypothetical protein